MLSAFVLAALAAPAAALPQTVAAHRPCATSGLSFAGKPGTRTQPRKLGELPPANLYLTVHRQMGGCPIPAIVRTRAGG